MNSDRRRIGLGVSGLGAAGLGLALWQPFYRFAIPDSLVSGLERLGQAFGVSSEQLGQSAAQLRGKTLGVTAWQAFGGADVLLCIIAILAVGLVLQGLSGNRFIAVGEGGALSALALVGAALVLYHVVARPLPAEVLSVARGAWMALAGAAAIGVGGLLAGAPAPRTTPGASSWEDAAPSPAAWSASGSVAPPS